METKFESGRHYEVRGDGTGGWYIKRCPIVRHGGGRDDRL